MARKSIKTNINSDKPYKKLVDSGVTRKNHGKFQSGKIINYSQIFKM